MLSSKELFSQRLKKSSSNQVVLMTGDEKEAILSKTIETAVDQTIFKPFTYRR